MSASIAGFGLCPPDTIPQSATHQHALAAGIEYIESIGIQKAYERVIESNLF
jgi:hypothetical protein